MLALEGVERAEVNGVLGSVFVGTGSWTIDRVASLTDEVTDEELHARLYTLLDLADPAARREHDTWTAGPLTDPAAFLPETAGDWRARGLRCVGVTRQGVPVALVGMAPEAAPLAEAVVAAAREAGTVMLAGDLSGLGGRLGIDEVVPGGARLARSVRALQAGGHGVAVVSGRPTAALAHADLSIGVLRGPAPVPWDADVISEIDEVHLLLSCLAPARRTSERCVWLGVAGAAAGAALTAFGPAAGSVRRAQLVSDCTALASIATGEWAGRNSRRGTPPVRADRTPWHAMSVKDVLALLGSSPSGITGAEAMRRRTSSRPGEPKGPDSLLRTSVEELANPLTPVLTAGAGLSALVGSIPDAVMIGAVMIVNTLTGGASALPPTGRCTA